MYSNIISIGDHCIIPILLKELNIRKKSFPFDWTTHEDQLQNTNIMHNIECIKRLDHDSIDDIVKDYIGDVKSGKNGHICFPHEVGTKEEIVAKYKRRFERFKQSLQEKNIYIMLTRHYYIDPSTFETIMKTVLHHDSMLIFISGTYHAYFETMNYKNVIFKYIYYDISKFYQYDYTVFRPMVKSYLTELHNAM